MATNYGVDTYCLTDTGLTDVIVLDPKILIGQRLVRALTIPQGALALIGGDPRRGFDLRSLVNAKMTTANVLSFQQQINAECAQDEEVLSADAVLTLVGSTLTCQISVVSAPGPFQLTVSVSQLDVTAIFTF
jgi:hypothetical protein